MNLNHFSLIQNQEAAQDLHSSWTEILQMCCIAFGNDKISNVESLESQETSFSLIKWRFPLSTIQPTDDFVMTLLYFIQSFFHSFSNSFLHNNAGDVQVSSRHHSLDRFNRCHSGICRHDYSCMVNISQKIQPNNIFKENF